MTDSRIKILAGGSLVGVAAGLAGALLFVLAARGSFLTMALGYFAPLPVMVACISYGLSIGVAAAIIGSGFVALAYHPVLGLFFGLSIAAPAVALSAAAILAPPRGEGRARDLAPNYAVVAAALIAVLTISGLLLFATVKLGGFEALLARVVKDGAPLVKQVLGEQHAAGPIDAEQLTRLLVWAAPIGLATSQLLMMLANLSLAGRVAVISGNLPRPWPSIPDDLAIPPAFGALFAAACGLTFIGGAPGVVAAIVASAFGAAFGLQGLAVAHALTRGASARFPLLFAMYALTFVLPPWPFCLLAIVGLVDAAFHLRTRKAAQSQAKIGQ